MHYRIPLLTTPLLATLVWASICDSAYACPTCKDSLHANGVATGYAVSIMLMLAMPLLIATFWAVVIYRLRKNMGRPRTREMVVAKSI